MRILWATGLALLLAIPAATVARADGAYVGSSKTLGGTIAACKGGQPMKGTIRGNGVRLFSAARDGTTRPAVGLVGFGGVFEAVKKLNTGGIIRYNGKVTARGISGKWRGPTCFGTFSLKR
jgi:hypothetical protein